MAVPLLTPIGNLGRRHNKTRKTLERLSESKVRHHCGLPSWGAKEVIELYDSLPGQDNSSIPIDTKVLIFLSQLRSGSFQWVIGGDCGVSRASVGRVIEQCSNHTFRFAKLVINFPQEIAERNQIKQDFLEIAKIPNTLGVVDGTHVPLIAPSQNEQIFVNRKLYHSINCQVVAGRDYKLFDIVAKWPGSTHDSYIWHNSCIKTRLYDGGLGNCHFLGDSGYGLERRLLVPFSSSTTVPREIRFNQALTKTRCVVERAIGNLKCRFRSLDKTGGFSCYKPAKACKLIVSCAAIHNICVSHQIPILEKDEIYRDTFTPHQVHQTAFGIPDTSASDYLRQIAYSLE